MTFRTLLAIIVFSIHVNTSNTKILRLPCKIDANFDIIEKNQAVTSNVFKTFTGLSQWSCLLECTSNSSCKSVNYKSSGGECELSSANFSISMSKLVSKTGWNYLTTDDNARNIGPVCRKKSPCQHGGTCVDTCDSTGYTCSCDPLLFQGQNCEQVKEYDSCNAVLQAGHTENGVYRLKNMGFHYCHLKAISGCSSGGWTHVMTIDGTKNTFSYTSSYWTTTAVYNNMPALSDIENEEAKFSAYHNLGFNRICLGMRQNDNSKRWIEIHTGSVTSLYNHIQDGAYRSTSLAKSIWFGLVSGSWLQDNCNQQGFNVLSKARIGIVANNENDCATPDSAVGFGIRSTFDACETSVAISNGNIHLCLNPNVIIRLTGYILVQ